MRTNPPLRDSAASRRWHTLHALRRLLLIAVSTLACTWLLTHAAHAAAEEVVIGWAGPEQRPHALALRQAAELALDEANQRNIVVQGKKLTFRLAGYNDNDNPNMAVLAARALVAAHAVAVIGHYTTEPTLAAGPVYAAAHVPEIAVFAPSPRLTQMGLGNVFQLLGDIEGATINMIAALRAMEGDQRIGVAYNGSLMGAAVADTLDQEMRRQGLTIAGRVSISARTSDFNAVLQMISAKHIDILYFAGVQQQAYALSERLRQTGSPARLLLSGGAFNPEFYDNAGPYADGTLLMAHGHAERQLPGFARFEKAYVARFKSPVMPYAANAYDAAGMVVEAIHRSGSLDPAVITRTLHSMRYDGLTGRIGFASDGRLLTPSYTLYQVQQGKWRAIRSFP